MTRDLIVLRLVAAEAQLRFIEGVARACGDVTMFKARVPALIDAVRRELESFTAKMKQFEGID